MKSETDMRIGVQLARSPGDLPAWFAGAPLRHHLHWLLRQRAVLPEWAPAWAKRLRDERP